MFWGRVKETKARVAAHFLGLTACRYTGFGEEAKGMEGSGQIYIEVVIAPWLVTVSSKELRSTQNCLGLKPVRG